MRILEETREWGLVKSRRKTIKIVLIVVIMCTLLAILWFTNIGEQQIQQQEEDSPRQTKKAPAMTTGTAHPKAQR